MTAAIGLKRSMFIFVAIAIAGMIVIIGEILVRRDFADSAREKLLTELNFLAGRLGAEIAASEHLGRGFAAVLSARGGMLPSEFGEACHMLMQNEPKVRNIALVVGSVITFNCPEAENSSTIGVDLRDRPDQWPAFERMQASGKSDIAGPVNLVQGGWAIIARTPIMRRSSDGSLYYWGALSIPLRLEGVLEQAGILDAAQRLNIAIRGNANASMAPNILLGDPAVFDGDPVVARIAFPDGDWFLGATVTTHPAAIWALGRQRIMIAAIALLCSSLFLLVAIYTERRRRMEQESNRYRDLLHAFMENSPIAMYVKDIQGRYIDLNAEARDAFKVGDRPYAQARSSDFFDAEFSRVLDSEDAQAISGKVVRTERNEPSGTKYGYEREVKFPVTDRDGKVIAIGGYVFDVSASKKAEKRLVEALRHAEAANRAKSEFLATMSHELRTPLNAIIGFSEIMKNQMFGPVENLQYLDYVAKIHHSGSLLSDLLGSLIDLSAIESGKVEPRFEQLGAADVIEDCRAVAESEIHEYGHELVIRNRATRPCRGDRRFLRQALINLISNAAKYTRRHGRIEITAEDTDRGVVFRVTDNGIGMSATDIERALQPFTRLGDPMRAEVGGSGIGLTLVKRLVEAMGGALIISSVPKEGTSVEITLPYTADEGSVTAA